MSTDLLRQLPSRSQNQSLSVVVTQVKLLQNSDRESGSLACPRLSLSNDISSWKQNDKWSLTNYAH